ncbi:MAG: polymer-forming cytoskeletal protein, partial [Thermoplasmata archaeon]
IIGDRADFGLGVITEGRVFIGEKARIKGDISAGSDIHVDMWSQIEGDVKGEKDVYLADKVKVKGKLSVGKDLELSDSAEIGKFEAKGWINVRSPVSLVIYVFLYIMELLRQGKSQEVEMILSELDAEDEEYVISDDFLFVPNDSEITLQRAEIKGNARIGDNCRVLGNYYISGSMKIGGKTKFHGSIDTGKGITIGSEAVISGNISSKGLARIEDQAQVKGDVSAKRIEMQKSSTVEGTIQAKDGVSFTSAHAKEVSQKIERFERGMEELDAVLD